MANIFEIQDDLWRSFQELEDSDGDASEAIIEKLFIGKENLKEKIKSYVSVIKLLENDNNLIKAEKERLANLEKSKKKAIEWLKTTMIRAVESFGDTAKNGSKYIDYGTGKVSVSNREIVDVNEDSVQSFTDSLIRTFTWLNMNNQLDKGIINNEELLDSINQSSDDNFTMEDLNNIDAEIDFDVTLRDLLESDNGFNLAKAHIRFNKFNIKAKVNKTNIKNLAKANAPIPGFAEMQKSKSIKIS